MPEHATARALAIASATTGLALALLSGAVAAHGGGLDAQGCHHDRKNGGYHCHRGSASRAPAAATLAPAQAARNNAANSRGASAPYRNCDAARAAGVAPVRRGDPGYGRHLDRDNDGIGCE
ncbi:MAG: excalibur calcium-binding domain-containing protein [Pseudomonadota bacterium]|nr:excalibur calcium-binding domain-containing protein [Pseudomonadota bacterium]